MTRQGVCRICKEFKELNFEHIPPRSAYNKNSRYYSIKFNEYFENLEKYLKKELKPKSKIEQGGMGAYCLCESCNSFLGSKYVREYKKFAEIAMSIISSYDKKVKSFQINIEGINLLKFLKQIIAIFVCSNDSEFTNTYSELLSFIKNPEMDILPERYRVYMYHK